MGNKCCNCASDKTYHNGFLISNSSVDSSYRIRRRGDARTDRLVYDEGGQVLEGVLSSARQDDEGQYTAEAWNRWGVGTGAFSLDVTPRVPGAPVFLRRLTDLAVKVATRTRFLVEITSPTDLKVTWNQDGNDIEEGERFHLVHEGSFYCIDVAPVSLQDSGRWTCVATNAVSTASCSCRLKVLVPKAYKKPEFLEELRAVLTAGGTVSLECKVVGVPTPSLRWFKDEQEIKAGDIFALRADPKDQASLGTYTCEASNCMGKATSTSRLQVSSALSPIPPESFVPRGPAPAFSQELRNEKVKIGGSITLECKVKVPPWPLKIQWYNKEGEVLEGGRYHIMADGLGSYSIKVDPVEGIDDGPWKCIATSDQQAKAFTSANLQVTYPKTYRKPKFLESLKAILTDEGLVSFECKVVGYPTPNLRWYKDGQELKPGDVYQLTGTNSLGSYCCIAHNCMGEASSTAELTIEDIQSQLSENERALLITKNQPPRFLQGLKSAEGKINEKLTFTVKVSISPEPTVLWFRDDEPIEESDKYSIQKEAMGDHHLHIKKLEFTDQAEWKCVAANDYGQSVTSCFLRLNIPKHYKKPKFLEDLKAVLSEEGAVNLECKVIGVPQPVLKWYKDGKELNPGDIHRIISGQDGTCCLGTYTCVAHNCMGTASSSASLLSLGERQVKPEDQWRNLARNTSLSTIQEERTSQLHDTTEKSVTIDERAEEISFSFDGKEVSVSLYETPDLTEEEALQIVEMYADQLSEHVTEHNVVELPPLRFTKESSHSGNILMEAVVIDVSQDYFSAADDDLRTDADMEEFSFVEDQGQNNLTPEDEKDFDKINNDLDRALSSTVKVFEADTPLKPKRLKRSEKQKSLTDEVKMSGEEEISQYTDASENLTQKESFKSLSNGSPRDIEKLKDPSTEEIKKKRMKGEKSSDEASAAEEKSPILSKLDKRKHRKSTDSEREDDSLREFEKLKRIESETSVPSKGKKEKKTDSEVEDDSLHEFEYRKIQDDNSVKESESSKSKKSTDRKLDSVKEKDKSASLKKESSGRDEGSESIDKFYSGEAVSVTSKNQSTEFQTAEEMITDKSEISVLESLAHSLKIIQKGLSVVETQVMKDSKDEPSSAKGSLSLLESLTKPLKEIQKGLEIVENQITEESQEGRYSPNRTGTTILETLAQPISEFQKNLALVEQQAVEGPKESLLEKTTQSIIENLVEPIEEMNNGIFQIKRRASENLPEFRTTDPNKSPSDKSISEFSEKAQKVSLPKSYTDTFRAAISDENKSAQQSTLTDMSTSEPDDTLSTSTDYDERKKLIMKSISLELEELEESANLELAEYYERLMACGKILQTKADAECNLEVRDILICTADLVNPLRKLTKITSQSISDIVENYENLGIDPSSSLVQSLTQPLEALKNSLQILENVATCETHKQVRALAIPVIYKLTVPMEELNTTVRLVENLSSNTAMEFLTAPLNNLSKAVSTIELKVPEEGLIEELYKEGTAIVKSLDSTFEVITNCISNVERSLPEISSTDANKIQLKPLLKPIEEFQKLLHFTEDMIEEASKGRMSPFEIHQFVQELNKPLQAVRVEFSLLQHQIEAEHYGEVSTGNTETTKCSKMLNLVQPLETIQDCINKFHESLVCKPPEEPMHLRYVLYGLMELTKPLNNVCNGLVKTEEAISSEVKSLPKAHAQIKEILTTVRELKEANDSLKIDISKHPDVRTSMACDISFKLLHPLQVVEDGLVDMLSDFNKKDNHSTANPLKTLAEPFDTLQKTLIKIEDEMTSLPVEHSAPELKQALQGVQRCILRVQDQVSFEYGDEPSSIESNIALLQSLVQPMQTLKQTFSDIHFLTEKSICDISRCKASLETVSECSDQLQQKIASLGQLFSQEDIISTVLKPLETIISKIAHCSKDANNYISSIDKTIATSTRDSIKNSYRQYENDLDKLNVRCSIGLKNCKREEYNTLQLTGQLINDLTGALSTCVKKCGQNQGDEDKFNKDFMVSLGKLTEKLTVCENKLTEETKEILATRGPLHDVKMKGGINVDEEIKENMTKLRENFSLHVNELKEQPPEIVKPLIDKVTNDIEHLSTLVNVSRSVTGDKTNVYERITALAHQVEIDLQKIQSDVHKDQCTSQSYKSSIEAVSKLSGILSNVEEQNRSHNVVTNLEHLNQSLSDLKSSEIKQTQEQKISGLEMKVEVLRSLSELDLKKDTQVIKATVTEIKNDLNELSKDVPASISDVIIKGALVSCEKIDDLIREETEKAREDKINICSPQDIPLIKNVITTISNMNSHFITTNKLVDDKGQIEMMEFLNNYENAVITLGEVAIDSQSKAETERGQAKITTTVQQMEKLVSGIRVALSNEDSVKCEKVIPLLETLETSTSAIQSLIVQSSDSAKNITLPTVLQSLMTPLRVLHSVVQSETFTEARTSHKSLDISQLETQNKSKALITQFAKASSDLEEEFSKLEESLKLPKAQAAIMTKVESLLTPVTLLNEYVNALTDFDSDSESLYDKSNISILKTLAEPVQEIKKAVVKIQEQVALEATGKFSQQKSKKLLAAIATPIKELKANVALIQEQANILSANESLFLESSYNKTVAKELFHLKEAVSGMIQSGVLECVSLKTEFAPKQEVLTKLIEDIQYQLANINEQEVLEPQVATFTVKETVNHIARPLYELQRELAFVQEQEPLSYAENVPDKSSFGTMAKSLLEVCRNVVEVIENKIFEGVDSDENTIQSDLPTLASMGEYDYEKGTVKIEERTILQDEASKGKDTLHQSRESGIDASGKDGGSATTSEKSINEESGIEAIGKVCVNETQEMAMITENVAAEMSISDVCESEVGEKSITGLKSDLKKLSVTQTEELSSPKVMPKVEVLIHKDSGILGLIEEENSEESDKTLSDNSNNSVIEGKSKEALVQIKLSEDKNKNNEEVLAVTTKEDKAIKHQEEILEKEKEKLSTESEKESKIKTKKEIKLKDDKEITSKEEEGKQLKEKKQSTKTDITSQEEKEKIDKRKSAHEEKLMKEKEDQEIIRKEENVRKEKEEKERIAKEEKEMKEKEEIERKDKEEREKNEREEIERKAKEEKDRIAREEKERIAKDEKERIAREEKEKKEKERIAKEEKEKKEREEEERKAKEKKERIEKEEKVKKEEKERLAKEEKEKNEREEKERKAKEEKERIAKEEKERIAKEEKERIAKQEKEKKEKERIAKEEKEKKEKEEKERIAKEEKEKKEKEEKERIAKDEKEKKEREEKERIAKEEKAKKEKEEKERIAKDEKEKKEREEKERIAKEEKENKEKEEKERLAKEEKEKKEKEEKERIAKEDKEKKEREEKERKAKEEKEKKEKKEREEKVRKAKEDKELKEKEEKEKIAREEKEKKEREEKERKAKEEKEKKEREEKERITKEEKDKKDREEKERLAKEEKENKEKARKDKEEKEEKERLAKEEKLKKEKEEKERKTKEEKEKKDREENERKAIKEKERKEMEEKERLAKEEKLKKKKEQEEKERKTKKENEKKDREENERKAKEEKEKNDKMAKERKSREEKEAKNITEKEKRTKAKVETEKPIKQENETKYNDERQNKDKVTEENNEKSKVQVNLGKANIETNYQEKAKYGMKTYTVEHKEDGQERKTDLTGSEYTHTSYKNRSDRDNYTDNKHELGRRSENLYSSYIRDSSSRSWKTMPESDSSTSSDNLDSGYSLDGSHISRLSATGGPLRKAYSSDLTLDSYSPKRNLHMGSSTSDFDPTSVGRRTDYFSKSRLDSRLDSISSLGELPSYSSRHHSSVNMHLGPIRQSYNKFSRSFEYISSTEDLEYRRSSRESKPVFSVRLMDRTVVQGSTVKLTCSIIGNPEPSIEWLKDSIPISDSLYTKYQSKLSNGVASLEITKVVLGDAGNYTCIAKNKSGHAISSSYLKVFADFEPSPAAPVFTKIIKDTYKFKEDRVVLECKVQCQPPPSILWFKDGHPLSVDPRFQQSESYDGTCQLSIFNPETADSGCYTCKARNQVSTEQISHYLFFPGRKDFISGKERHFRDPRKPAIAAMKVDREVPTGGTLALQVQVTGTPRPEVVWLREGKVITTNISNVQCIEDKDVHTLILRGATPGESGSYTCRASNKHGSADSTTEVQVTSQSSLTGGKPAEIVNKPDSFISISVGEDITLAFHVSGDPKPQVSWSKGINDLTNSGRCMKETFGNYVRLTMKRATILDSGTYFVLAKNLYGTDRAFVTVKVADRARSLTPTICRDESENQTSKILKEIHESMQNQREVPGDCGEAEVVDVGRNWVTLAWKKPETRGAGPILAYKVEAWSTDQGARWIELGMTGSSSLDVFNLNPGSVYKFRVTARNRYGWGESSVTKEGVTIGTEARMPEFTTDLPGQIKTLMGHSVNLTCQVEGEPRPDIQWYKNGATLGDKDGVRLTRDGVLCNLAIDEATMQHEARYTCEATNRAGRVSTFARLMVVSDPKLLAADSSLKRRLSEGSTEMAPQFTMRLRERRVQMTYPVRLTCQVAGLPEPMVLWTKDGIPLIQDSFKTISKDGRFYTLELSRAMLEDAGEYSARAVNEHGSVACKAKLTVDKGIRAYVAPEFINELPENQEMCEGDELHLMAQVEAYPSVGISWHRDGVKLRPSRQTIMTLDRDGIAELRIRGINVRNAGLYTCTASNTVGIVESTCQVDIVQHSNVPEQITVQSPQPYSKAPLFVTKPRSTEAVEGDTVVILCEVVGDPKPEVAWLRDWLKPEYYSDGEKFRRIGDGPEYRLEIRGAKLDHTGAYSVVATNQHGQTQAIISLQIKAKGLSKEAGGEMGSVKQSAVETLPLVTRPLRDLRCCDGDSVVLECSVHASPEPDIRWEKDGRIVHMGEEVKSSLEDERARLHIARVYPEDEGVYTCVASNSLGKATTSACLIVDVAEEKEWLVSGELSRPTAIRSAGSTPRSTPRSTPARSPSPNVTRGGHREYSGLESRRQIRCSPRFYSVPHDRVAEEGETVRMTASARGMPSPWTTWTKDGKPITPSARLSVTERDDLRVLEIRAVTKDDAGTYRVALENDYGRVESSARLDVIVRGSGGRTAGTVRAWGSSPSFSRRLSGSTSHLGTDFTFSADVQSTPSPSISWYRNGKMLVRTEKVVPTWDGRTARLEVFGLEEDDAGIYTCVAENCMGRTRCSAELVVLGSCKETALRPPVFVQGLLDSSTATEGQPFELLVQLQGSEPMDAVWIKDGVEVPDCPDFRYVSYGKGRFGLRIADPFTADSGVYNCEVFSQHGEAVSTTVLRVIDNGFSDEPNEVNLKRLHFTKTPTPVITSSGNCAKFCVKVSNPSDREPNFIWEIAGNAVKASSERFKVKSDGDESVLEINPVAEGDTCEVFCEVTVCVCEDDCDGCLSAKTGAQLRVSTPPDRQTPARILSGPADTTALAGDRVILQATFQGYPKPNVRWLRQGREMETSARVRVDTGKGVTCLVLEPVLPDDSAKYILTVENSLGSDCGFASLAVEGCPEPPSGAPCINQSGAGAVTVAWSSPPYDGGSKITGYTVEISETDKDTWTTLTDRCLCLSHVAQELKVGTCYSFRVRSHNIHGASEPSLQSSSLLIKLFEKEEDASSPEVEHKQVQVEPGQVFRENYDVLEELGKGRYGVVHKVVKKEESRSMAAKFVRCIMKQDREKVYEEIDIMNCLRHPKLLQLYAAYENPKDIIMIMEYISGGELFERVVADDFTLTEKDCILFMRQICDGVGYMHKNNVVHLDLKPENIMCSTRTSHQIKLIDFGLAQKLKLDGQIRVLQGTPEFIPPEIVNYEPIGTESDMWSVGVICYVLLSGLSPFMGDSDTETFTNITRADYDFDDEAFESISKDAKDFISSLLIKRKEKRLSADKCMRHKWLAQEDNSMSKVALCTDKLKKFIIHRKWQTRRNG